MYQKQLTKGTLHILFAATFKDNNTNSESLTSEGSAFLHCLENASI